jgi:integrase/recombinase XerC
MKPKPLATLVQTFFTVTLPQRGMSPLTLLSYRDALKLLLRFAGDRLRSSVVKLEVADLTDDVVREFLRHLERDRRNSIATRNNRLAAIRSFFTFVAGEDPAVADHCKRVCAVPMRRAPIKTIPYLERDEMEAVLEGPDRATALGRRDYAMLLFLYNSGARVQELIDVRTQDLKLTRPAHVLLRGKGRKERICPLWPDTARTLRQFMEGAGDGRNDTEPLFRNAVGEPITRFGVAHVLKQHVEAASSRAPSLRAKRVSPHVIRHTAAVHMLNSGVDINVIRAWLGHVDLATTNIYAEIDLATKRRAIESCQPPRKARRVQPKWQYDRDLLRWLEDL